MAPAPERWHRIEALYHAARDHTPSARAAFLADVCVDDEALRGEIEALLAEDLSRPPGHPQVGQAGADEETVSMVMPGIDSTPAISSSRFRVTRRIGEGGMGIVYEAWDKERSVRSALKTLTGVNPDSLYLFKNEFRSLADMSHPNLVALYELFQEEGQWFFSMEYVEGVHFLEFVQAASHSTSLYNPANDWNPLRSCLAQLTHAVLALHNAGILHRDLKPANVKVTPEGRVVVLDFGLAAHRARSRFDDAPAQEGMFGTVPYMAPELVRGERIAEPADWYAVGVMLYEALSGRRPFEGPSSRILADKRKLEAPPVSNFASDIPADLNTICMGLVTRDAESRMAGAQLLTLLGGDAPQTIEARNIRASRPPKTESVFVGRESQLAILRDAFAATADGASCTVLVHGKSGLGKSALVARFLESLTARGDTVILSGRCYEQESLPYKALDSAIDSLSRYLAGISQHDAAALMPRDVSILAQIFPVLRRVQSVANAPARAANPDPDQYELRRRAFGALRELLARLSDRRRVVLYLDDLQWGDLDSARLLSEILRPPEAPALLVIGTYRSEETSSSPFLEELLRNGGAVPAMDIRDMPVSPLNAEESAQLAAALLARSPAGSGRAEQIARESGGNPYFVQELIAAGTSGDAAEGSLDSALWSRIVELPADARRVLEAIAIAGQPIEEKLVCEAAGAVRDPKMFVILRTARMIRGSHAGDRAQVEAWHDRVRETIVNRLDPEIRRHHHLRLGEALESRGHVDAERVATHFEGAGETAKAGGYYRDAAEAASSTLAFKHSAGLFRKALDLLQPQGNEKRQLTVRLADALANAGRGVEAARQYQLTAQSADGSEAMDLERRAAYWFSVSGHVDDGREALDNLLRRVGVRIPSPAFLLPAIALQELRLVLRGLKFRVRAEDRLSQEELDRLDALWDAARAFGIIDIPAGVYITDRLLLLALKTGERTRIARGLALAAVGASALPAVGRSRALKLLAVLEALAGDVPTPYIMGALPFTRSFVDFCLAGQWTKSLAELREAGKIFSEKCSGVAWEMSTIHIFTLWNLLYLGRYAESSQLAASFGRDSEERGDLYQATFIGSAILPFTEMVAGRPEQALHLMNESLARWTRRKYTVPVAASAYVRAWILLYRGDGAEAWKFLQAEWPALRRNLYLHLNSLGEWLHYAHAQSALSVGGEELLRAAERDAAVLERMTVGYAKLLAHLIRAGCAAKRGDRQSAIRLLETAAAGFEKCSMSMMAATAHRRLAELLGEARGQALIHEADHAMKAEGVADPARLTNVFANGFSSQPRPHFRAATVKER